MSSIVHVTQLIPTLSRGGAERVVKDLVTQLDRQRFASDVIAFVTGGPLEEEIRNAGIAVTVFQKRTKLGLGVAQKINKQLRTSTPAILHAHLAGAEIWGMRAARKAGVPATLITVHSTYQEEPQWRLTLRKHAWSEANVLVAVSVAVQDFLLQNGVPLEKIRVIPNGIDINKFEPGWVRKNERRVLGTVGRLEKAKGHDVLIRALAQLPPTVELKIAGVGSQRKNLEKLIVNLGLSNRVHLVGDVLNIADFLRGCDLFVFPSLWEGLGLALIEAAAMKLPIVATSVGGTPEVVRDGESARLVQPNDPTALAEAISWMLEHPEDAKRMGEQARKTVVERFSVEQMVAAYSALYEEIVRLL